MNIFSRAQFSVVAVLFIVALFACAWVANVANAQTTDDNDRTNRAGERVNADPSASASVSDTSANAAVTDSNSNAGSAAAALSAGAQLFDNLGSILPDIGGVSGGVAGAAFSVDPSTSTPAGAGNGFLSGVPDVPLGPAGFGGGADGSGLSTADLLAFGDTSNIGPHVKCVLLQQFGSPIPSFSDECEGVTPSSGGRITITKNTIGGDGTFDFNFGSGVSTSITTTGGSGTVTFALNSGSIAITEGSQTNWNLDSAICTDNGNTIGSSIGGGWQVDLGVNGHIFCIFQNSFSTTTPEGGGGDNGEGGNGDNSHGGGSNNSGSNGGHNGGGSSSPSGQVAGENTENPGMGGGVGIPNTGAGGTMAINISMLFLSFLLMTGGLITLRKFT